MGDWIFGVAAGLLVLSQLFVCVFAKRGLLRLLPFMVSIALIIFCFIMYLSSGKTNWGYIILIGLLGITLLLQSVILLANRFLK